MIKLFQINVRDANTYFRYKMRKNENLTKNLPIDMTKIELAVD